MKIFTKWRITLSAMLISIFLFVSSGSLTGPCYYSQIIYGELQILINRTPVASLLADKNTSDTLKKNLREISEMREFAISKLGLPETGSFTSYVDTGRGYATWVLTATPEFSVIPKTWCFPVAGCSSFLGFFNEKTAERAKEKLTKKGYDVSLRGVTAYSTIGWFSDPVMNTHFDRSLPSLAGLVFHEKAHEKLFIKGDTPFNEAFATFVEQTGKRLWIVQHYKKNEVKKILNREKYAEDFSMLMSQTNRELSALYGRQLLPEKTRILKKEIFIKMQVQYTLLKKKWGGYTGYDAWFEKNFNNAGVVNQETYKSLIPFFQKLFDLSGKNFGPFYEQVKKISKLSKKKRYEEIQKVLLE
ncbi:hypothetical protein D4R99_02720 [bacterium]|nr:MAG: hypothetical protein D4R99_02720 [bacterium]